MIDVVYILGKGSIWGNNEIKYSLRSLEKHAGEVTVHIVGELPRWGIKNVNHIPYPDSHKCKERNIFDKIKRACIDDKVSDQFLFMNDDHFFLQNTDLKLPYYYKGELVTSIKNKIAAHRYTRAMQNTVDVLTARGYNTLHFDSHFPMIIDKADLFQVNDAYKGEWAKYPDGFVVKSLYCNTLKKKGQHNADCKLNNFKPYEDIMRFIRERKMFSISDIAINDPMIKIFMQLYPKQSQYEH